MFGFLTEDLEFELGYTNGGMLIADLEGAVFIFTETNIDLYGIHVGEDTEGLIEDYEDLANFEYFGIEINELFFE